MLAKEIESVVHRLLELKKEHPVPIIDKLPEFDQFKKDNKLLYEMELNEDMDLGIFKQMMKMKRRLEDGEDQYSVDVKFGKFMAEKYIDPVVDKIPPKNE